MAALLAGVQYGLSSQGNLNENKSLIFVKLTDSAYRAIEEYIRNKNNCSRAPTIQFSGNEGHLSLPSSQSARATDFNFSLTSNEDIEGPQGSFECIQQVAPRCLESVGALHCKMRVQAKDDVYDKTRQKMAEAEEMHKTKCTREIELDIGRRIKSRGRMPTGGGGGGNAARLGFSPTPMAPGNVGPPVKPALGSAAPRGSAKDDITRRPIRDRLIHMLAVRPYKKPELHAAVQREGLRDKDRNQLTATLSSIAMQRDNTYYLLRHVWNDVSDDWPFYTAQDRQTLKRRKPQNLTPPGSSDGGSSTSSGQSPNSLQPGSPPSLIDAAPASAAAKRPGYIDGVDGFQTKRQRISRVVQGGPTASGGSRPMSLGAATRSTPRDEAAMIYNKGGGTGGGGGYSSKYASSGVTAAVRWTTPSPTPLTNQPQANHNSHHNQSANSLSPASPTVSSSSSSYSSSSSFSPSYPPSSSSLHSHPPPPPPPHNDRQPEAAVSTGSSRQQVTTGSSRQQPEVTTGSSRQQPEVVTTGSSDSSRRKADQQQSSSTPMITISASSDHVTGSLSVSSLGALSSMTVSSSSSSSTSGAVAASRGGHTNSREYHNEPKYLIDYPRIETLEERRRYKADFNTNYMEYRALHSRVDKVARKFAALEESLKKEQKDSPAWKSIKNAILEQYQNVKLDKDYQSARQRFGYLHNKLSHIKQRVHEYDTLQCRPPIL